MIRAQLAIAGIGAARSAAELDEGLRSFRATVAEANAEIEATANRAKRSQVKELYRDTKILIDGYLALGSEFAAAQKASLDALESSSQAAEAWNRALTQLLSLPVLAESPNRLGLEVNLREAGSLFNAAGAALWQFTVTAAPGLKDQVARRAKSAIDVLKPTRLLAGERQLVAEIDLLAAAADRFEQSANQAVNAEVLKNRVFKERLLPAAKEIGIRVGKAVAFGNEFAQARHSELLASMDSVGVVALTVGMLVVLVLIGSALFSVLTIARPIRRIGDVLLELANGNKAVEIPFTERGDEVGDNARAAHTFKAI
jgi:methyl-accepting chemotaxis protein